jgi:hypothetical protein
MRARPPRLPRRSRSAQPGCSGIVDPLQANKMIPGNHITGTRVVETICFHFKLWVKCCIHLVQPHQVDNSLLVGVDGAGGRAGGEERSQRVRVTARGGEVGRTRPSWRHDPRGSFRREERAHYGGSAGPAVAVQVEWESKS